MNIKRPLILATASPARRELVANLGLKFKTASVSIDETPLSGENVVAYVQRLAQLKSDAVMDYPNDALIITVDTAIGFQGEIIGKPRDERHARETLGRLSGKTHEVVSAVVIKDVVEDELKMDTTHTEVRFNFLSKEMIDWYVGTGEWRERAGAYAIQAKGAAFIKDVKGCFTNVIGLSVPSLLDLLKGF